MRNGRYAQLKLMPEIPMNVFYAINTAKNAYESLSTIIENEVAFGLMGEFNTLIESIILDHVKNNYKKELIEYNKFLWLFHTKNYSIAYERLLIPHKVVKTPEEQEELITAWTEAYNTLANKLPPVNQSLSGKSNMNYYSSNNNEYSNYNRNYTRKYKESSRK
jgi:hypothetical protein